MTLGGSIAVLLVGAIGTSVVAALMGMPANDSLQLAGIAGLAALSAGIIGALVLRAVRRSSVGVQATVAGLTTTGAVAVGAAAAAERMFFSEHDLEALVVVLFSAAAMGAAISMWLGHRVSKAGAALTEVARRIGHGEVVDDLDATLPSELRKLAEEMNASSRKLDESRARERASEASRRELVAWVSHDLRTPLSGIRAMAEALEDGVVSDAATVARYHRSLREETDRLSGLVDDLFELSRIHSGTLRLQMAKASLADLVSDAIAAASGIARVKNVRLEGGMLDQVPEIQLSTPEMARVLRNLLENAIRHTPSDGAVSVEAGVEGDHAFVSVSDACGGIPQSDIDRVFDVAFRGESARTPGGNGGGGLGLAIARGIVEAHRGDIDVRNEGDGCRFTVRLPLTEDVS